MGTSVRRHAHPCLGVPRDRRLCGECFIGTTVEAFILPDFHGKLHGLDDYRDQCVVLAFLGTECPLAKHYGPRLRDLATEFERKGVAFRGFFSFLKGQRQYRGRPGRRPADARGLSA